MTKKALIPKGYYRVAENANLNGTVSFTAYANRQEGKLFLVLEGDEVDAVSFGPFNPAFLDLIVICLSDLESMKGKYYAV